MLNIRSFLFVVSLLLPALTIAAPLAAPGDMQLRHDLQLLNDSGVINIPLTAWPVSLGDVHAALDASHTQLLSSSAQSAYVRVKRRLGFEMDTGSPYIRLGLSGSHNPRIIRSFENTPREEGEARAELSWLGERFSLNLSATYAANPFDGDEFRPDGTYVGMALGNWMLTAGWQERWWGPSRDGSLILSTNARPTPGIAIQRNNSTAFKTKWLSWLGPWTLTSFMTNLDDERVVNDALLFGMRGSFRPPHTGLEIGFSRTAQWCGDDRPCSASTFWDLLLGKDNRGVNVDPDKEPGNQLAGLDIRWKLPKKIPVAVYMQWIGEDGRPGGGLVGAWSRQLGVEVWGDFGGIAHRTQIEVSDTTARQGGFGFSDKQPNYTYEHTIYRSGYRYNGRPLGHGADGDSLSYSIGSTLVQSAGHTWNILLRHMKINRDGPPDSRHSLSPVPLETTDLQISHERETPIGRFYVGIGFSKVDESLSNVSNSDVTGFIQWSTH